MIQRGDSFSTRRDEPLQTESIQKTLARLLSVSANRVCADCRTVLVDPSQVYASISPELELSQKQPAETLRCINFEMNHFQFAPPNLMMMYPAIPQVSDPPIDPALLATQRAGGGHGVFVCSLCGSAHKLLGRRTCVVHAVQDVSAWTHSDVSILDASGGNARSSTVFEAFLPPEWEQKRPKAESNTSERLFFIRAKYDALAFLLPQSGPLSFHSWQRIVQLHPEWRGLRDADLYSDSTMNMLELKSSLKSNATNGSSSMRKLNTETITRRSELPDRLVDYFCVISASECIDPYFLDRQNNDVSDLTSPEDIMLIPTVTDCFPSPGEHGREDEFPQHISTFLFPDGCRPCLMSMPPTFFIFTLTASNGDRLYGGVLTLTDQSQDVDFLRAALENSDYSGPLPSWLEAVSQSNVSNAATTNSSSQYHHHASSSTTFDSASDTVYLPTCLVVISHYPFFDLWRKFLLQLYRIVLVGAPLPIERYIANFVCEVPLPPPGKIRVIFGFTIKDNWCVERPPDNQLPLANFSFQPLFAALSIPNVLIVFACLMQEMSVALVCKHYGILGSVAEALTSLLFPFHWEGMYVPILPYHMIDILDAPIPFLVGLHSRYLRETSAASRPKGVVYVDLDRDIVHLGYDEEIKGPRTVPCLPGRQATKLRSKLDEFAASVYIIPPSGLVASVTSGDEEPLSNSLVKHTPYLNLPDTSSLPMAKSLGRRTVFSNADKAYRDNRLQAPTTDFLSEFGQFFDQQTPPPSTETPRKVKLLLQRAIPHATSNDLLEENCLQEHLMHHLLERKDAPGFSTDEIRNAFLRYFVSLMLDYRQFLERDSFQSDDFIASLHLSALSSDFVRHFVKTQMFDRFIDERRENSNDPEVQFFDESIAAKIKRSTKRNVLAHIGRAKTTGTGTSFLKDQSKNVTETYTPPPPSNWGLPDDGRTYSYGTFPSLNPDLFGKVRPPRTWRNRRGSLSTLRTSRRASLRTAASEQALVSKAMLPVVRSTKPLLKATKRGAKSLEKAISSLSNQFSAQPSNGRKQDHDIAGSRMSTMSEITFPGEIEVESFLMSTENFVLNVRRKQSILLGILIALQLACKSRYKRKKPLHFSNMDFMQKDENISGSLQQSQKECVAATTVQCCVRTLICRRFYQHMRNRVSRVQSIFRGRKRRFSFTLIRITIIRLQGLYRGFSVRLNLMRLISCRLLFYKDHLVLLWRKSCTSLCYRSMFWSLIRKKSVLLFNLVEDEILRLWNELRMTRPSFGNELDNFSILTEAARIQLYSALHIKPTEVQEASLKMAAKLGAGNRIYVQALMLHEHAAPGQTPSKKSLKLLISNAKQSGIMREYAERIQVYDRLAATQEDQLSLIVHRFRIPIKEKRKKVLLSEFIWSDVSVADESSDLMIELFPELKDISDMHFREATKKTRSRFKHWSSVRPVPLNSQMRVNALYLDRIRRGTQAVAVASLHDVPQLLERLATLEERQNTCNRDINRRLQLHRNNHGMEEMGLSEIRVAAMRELF